MVTTSRSILIVEDIPHVLELLDVTLRYKGYSVVTAKDGEEALKRIGQAKPSLILTDIMMPKLDGFALAQEVRSNPDTQDIPIVFVSATFITPEDKEFALSLGAVTFLEKPVDTQELLLTVGEVLTETMIDRPKPLSEETFYRGYRQRLEAKLKHKKDQVVRARRLVQAVPEEQREAFESLLQQTESQRDQIEAELKAFDQHLEI
ncbi:MAG: response regulator [Anaerolineales bacterium]|nr:response regulator [Anaerolineales bacterium]